MEPVKNVWHRVDDLQEFMAHIGDFGCVMNDSAACPQLRTYDAYNFTQPLYGGGYHLYGHRPLGGHKILVTSAICCQRKRKKRVRYATY